MAAAGVRKNEPATMVRMKGRPKRAKGWRTRLRRYQAAMALWFPAVRNGLVEKVGDMLDTLGTREES